MGGNLRSTRDTGFSLVEGFGLFSSYADDPPVPLRCDRPQL